MSLSFLLYPLGAAALAVSSHKILARLQLSRAKHRSLAGHAKLSRWAAKQIPFYAYDQADFFSSDGADENIAARRRRGFQRLSDLFRERFALTSALTKQTATALSDLNFTSRYRVPFQYSRVVEERLGTGVFLKASFGVTLTDLDGNSFYDLTGSYGVNLFGYDVYKACIEEGAVRVRDLGPVLGAYHPVVADNIRRLREISGHDEVSFHMSGTEAVMQAVRLACYHTGRSHLVRFCGAYHGWWGDVQPGVGNPHPARHTYTLAEMSERSLRVLRGRRDIACVLVNPLQALHPNLPATADSALLDSGRSPACVRADYADWLGKLRAVCTERGIVLIFDEVFVGFRLARGGAQQYFRVEADLVTYGKTLGGGLPVGVLCGRRQFMKRFHDERPADICFARGTFNSHPYVMGAMAAFLERLDRPEFAALYEGLDAVWDGRAEKLNARLESQRLPVRVANFSSIWTVRYLCASRYNWMLQFYLRAEGLALSWVGTGRLIFSLDYTEDDFDEVAQRFVAAGKAMRADGWWDSVMETDKQIRRRIVREMLAARWRSRPAWMTGRG